MQSLHIFSYESPVVTIKERNAWITRGVFKLVHVIDLKKYDILVQETEQLTFKHLEDEEMRPILNYHITQIKERIDELRDSKMRKVRSVNWIGTAWKWIGGSPDATDWDALLKEQTYITENNNQQYIINRKLLDKTQEVTDKINKLIERYNNAIQKTETDKLRHDLLDKILILKEGINEIVRACQLAKNGIVNSNLLDSEEINAIVNELETLPYQNTVEAVEYGRPSVYCNGTLLLYVLSIPKIDPRVHHLITVHAAIRNNRQIDLDYSKLLVGHNETYGLNGDCLNIANTSVCEENILKKVPENSCISRILKGGNALCNYRTTNEEIVELVGENTIFLTNFNGTILNKNSSIPLEGTYLIQLDNDMVKIKEKTYYSKLVSSPQALPPVLTNITIHRIKPNLEYVHDLNTKNIELINSIKSNLNSSILTETFLFLTVIAIIFLLWRKIYGKVNVPQLRLSFRRKPIPVLRPTSRFDDTNGSSSCCPHSTCDLRDADI